MWHLRYVGATIEFQFKNIPHSFIFSHDHTNNDIKEKLNNGNTNKRANKKCVTSIIKFVLQVGTFISEDVAFIIKEIFCVASSKFQF